LLRRLKVPPETFITVPQPGTEGIAPPVADEAHRLRWNLGKLYKTLNAARTARGATWQQAADRLDCSPNQLTGLRTAKFAPGMWVSHPDYPSACVAPQLTSSTLRSGNAGLSHLSRHTDALLQPGAGGFARELSDKSHPEKPSYNSRALGF
jgi:hypothetical protein